MQDVSCSLSLDAIQHSYTVNTRSNYDKKKTRLNSSDPHERIVDIPCILRQCASFSADVQACVFRPGHVLRRVSGASDRHLNRTLRRNYSPTKIKTIHHSLCITHCCSYNLATISSHINSNASNV